MKKSLFTALCLVVFSASAFAATYDPASKVSTIGQNILTKNGITSSIKFEVTSKEVDNSTFSTDKTISISTDDLKYAYNDNETAAVVANELGHVITGNVSRDKIITSFTGTAITTANTATKAATSYSNLKSEKEADVIAVNLMANSGYNPLAAIVLLTRQTQTAWNQVLGKPANADRAMNIYDYTAYAYPAKLKAGYSCNEYKTFLTYADTVLTARKESKKLTGKNEKEMKKYRKNSVSKISKFKTRGGASGWGTAYELLKTQTGN